jgi:hypothetical protein
MPQFWTSIRSRKDTVNIGARRMLHGNDFKVRIYETWQKSRYALTGESAHDLVILGVFPASSFPPECTTKESR